MSPLTAQEGDKTVPIIERDYKTMPALGAYGLLVAKCVPLCPDSTSGEGILPLYR